jgi:hypothetical protein
MALGVNEAFPYAMFVHAEHPEDIEPHHLQRTVVLVDSVMNSGKTVATHPPVPLMGMPGHILS